MQALTCSINFPKESDFTQHIQYIPRNMHTVFALLCFVVVIHWLNFPYPSGLLHWHCGNLTIAPVPAKQPWWIWINTSCEFIMNDCLTTTKQSTTKQYAYFLGYTVCHRFLLMDTGSQSQPQYWNNWTTTTTGSQSQPQYWHNWTTTPSPIYKTMANSNEANFHYNT